MKDQTPINRISALTKFFSAGPSKRNKYFHEIIFAKKNAETISNVLKARKKTSNLLKPRTSFLYNLPPLCWPTLLLVCVSWIPYLRILSHELSFGDEGLVAQSAYRIAQGQIPFKDFFTAIVPGSYYFYALLFKLFEPSFLVLRLGVMLVSLLLLLSVWQVLVKFRIASFLPYLAAASFMAFFGGPAWFIASHHWLSTLFCVSSLALLLPDADSDAPSPGSALAAGILTAMAIATLQHRGAVWFIAVLAVIPLLPSELRRRTCLAYIGGVALVAIPVAAYFLYHAGYDTIFYDLITFPVKQYHNFEGHRGTSVTSLYELMDNVSTAFTLRHQPLGILRSATWSLGFAGLIVIYLLPFAGCLMLWRVFRTSRFSRYQTGCVTAFFISSYIATLHRLTNTTLIFAASATIILAAITVETLTPSRPSFSRTVQLSWSAFFIMIACCYSLLNVLSPKISVSTPAGSIQVLYSGEAETMQGVAAFAAQNFKHSSPLFCYPYSPIFYFLFRGVNPTPFDTLTWPMHTAGQMKQSRELLQKSRCKWIIMSSEVHDTTGFEAFLNENYIARRKFKYATILERRPLGDQ